MKENYINEILTFAKAILNIPSPSGYTENVINYINDEVNALG